MFLRLFLSNGKIIYRDRQALFWALAFPLIFVVVFGLFRLDQPPEAHLVIVDRAGDDLSRALIEGLKGIQNLEVWIQSDEAAARQTLADGKVEYVLLLPEGLARQATPPGSGATITLLYDQGHIETNSMVRGILGRILGDINMSLQGAQPLVRLEAQVATARHVGYFDFLLPGFVGLAVMTYGVAGMGAVVALYRQQKILKRIRATPLRVRTFFGAQVVAYLVLSLVQTIIVLAVGMLLFKAKVYGNLAWVLPLVLLANLTFLNIGFIVGSLSRSVEAASGLSNVVTLPMMFFSGVFFPTDTLPTLLRHVVQYLPLTPLLDALRGVMLEAKPIWSFPADLSLLALWVLATSVVAIRTFRFE